MALQSRHITLFSTAATNSDSVWSRDRWKSSLFRAAFCSEPPGTSQLHAACCAAQGSRSCRDSGAAEPGLPSAPCNLALVLPAGRGRPEPLPARPGPARWARCGRRARSRAGGGLEPSGEAERGAGAARSDLRTDKGHGPSWALPGTECWADLVNGACPLCSWPRATPSE